MSSQYHHLFKIVVFIRSMFSWIEFELYFLRVQTQIRQAPAMQSPLIKKRSFFLVYKLEVQNFILFFWKVWTLDISITIKNEVNKVPKNCCVVWKSNWITPKWMIPRSSIRAVLLLKNIEDHSSSLPSFTYTEFVC